MTPMAPQRHPPAEGESDTNLSPLRRAWQQHHVGPAGRAMVEEDARLFLHQSVSSPCLTAIRRAEGIWIEDADGRRAMDFHGNSVHHIGYGHPRLKAAIARQMDELAVRATPFHQRTGDRAGPQAGCHRARRAWKRCCSPLADRMPSRSR